MSAPAPEFPTYRLPDFLPAFALGWGLGAALTFALRALGQAWLPDVCRGHTLAALLLPLLLGPGGLGFTAANWRRPARAAVGLGLVVASLMPALYVGARDIAELRRAGCAGGYIVFAPAGGASVSGLSLAAGESRELTGRLGGFQPQTPPEQFSLQAQSSTPGVAVSLPRARVGVGEVFPVRITVAAGAGVNTYTVGVRASSVGRGNGISATGTLELAVRAAP